MMSLYSDWRRSMRTWLRRIRGAIGIGFTWGAVWAVAGLVPRWLFGVNSDVPFPLVFGLLGFIAGVTFSGLLALTAAVGSSISSRSPHLRGGVQLAALCSPAFSPA